MPSVTEGAAQQNGPLNPALVAGLRTLSDDQQVEFTQHIRYVLPADGYIFWLGVQQTKVRGSLHVQTMKYQREDETISINKIVFTTSAQTQMFQDIGSDTIWVGQVGEIKFAFSSQSEFYRAAGLWHYAGDAVYPALESQLVSIGSQLPTDTLVVSDSLPAWLALKSYTPFWLAPTNPGITLFPSFLVPDNERPPYGAVHIEPNSTAALQAIGSYDINTTYSQLASDRVRITLYGLTNNQAIDFLSLTMQYFRDNDAAIGLMNMPVMRDEKRTQPELSMIAMKKTIDYEVSYFQTRINDIARQQIEAVSVSFSQQPFPA